ncbi:polysaccharide deacetylase family protein [Streptococcus suis]
MAKRKHGRHKHQKVKRFPVIFTLLSVLLIGTLVFCLVYFYQDPGSRTDLVQQTPETPKEEIDTTPSQKTGPEEVTWVKQKSPVRLPILMYHAIHVMAPEETANTNLIVDPSTFESHLKALQEAGYYTLSPEEALRVLRDNVVPDGKKVVWLTFDDSLWDFHSHAYPLLKQYQMKATNFVITGFTENGTAGYLTVNQMLEMKEHDMSFQGHTVNHPDLAQSSLESQSIELSYSKQFLNQQLSQETIALAYPAGRYSADTLAVAENTGYQLGLTTNHDLASVDNGMLSLNRLRVLPTTTADILLEMIQAD